MRDSLYQRSGKRLCDLGLALLLIVPASAVVAISSIIIRAGSRGPAILRQTRVGRLGKSFTCYKLRTMFSDTPYRASHETSANAVTPVGRWLRATKLDELPQLINVLRGDMSFVGPRPCLPSQGELIAARERAGVLAIAPGITGVAQAAGVDMSNPERLAALDATYLGRQSFALDLNILRRTLLGHGRGDRVRAD